MQTRLLLAALLSAVPAFAQTTGDVAPPPPNASEVQPDPSQDSTIGNPEQFSSEKRQATTQGIAATGELDQIEQSGRQATRLERASQLATIETQLALLTEGKPLSAAELYRLQQELGTLRGNAQQNASRKEANLISGAASFVGEATDALADDDELLARKRLSSALDQVSAARKVLGPPTSP